MKFGNLKNFIQKYLNKIPEFLRYFLYSFLLIGLLFFLFDLAFPFGPELDYSQVILSSEGKIMHAYLNKDDKWRIRTELHEVSPELRKTIVFKEDKYFMFHPGVNVIAIVRALIMNMTRGEITSGASTISMQVARMLQPAKRNYFSKFREMVRAMQLELHYSKSEILLMYMNLIPYGGNIEGIKTAALLYLQQEPEALSLAQIIELSIIPNNPRQLNPAKDYTMLRQQRDQWLRYFEEKKVFPIEMIKDALMEETELSRGSMPRQAPHFSLLLRNMYPQKTYIASTLNLEKQINLQHLVYNYIQPLKRMGISNAAVIVLNNITKEVEVYIGSADFNDKEHHGEVNGVNAIRSPGSALKPFLYALSFDKGLTTPKSVIYDISINYGGYMPENYDGKFNGAVTVEKALAQSLNIPAVKVLDMIGLDCFIEKMSSANFQTIKTMQKDLGYSVVLGGCGVNLFEITQAFSAFANNGLIYDFSLIKDQQTSVIDTFCSSAATYMITEILSSPKRADMPVNFENSIHLPKIAWKTGTSYGRRDAWAIGYSPIYTIGVWMGNFPGIGVAELNGTEFAVPLLFSAFNALDAPNTENWFALPKDVDFRLVCSETGLPPSDFCTDLIMDAFIPGVSNHTKCQHLIEVAVDKDEKISYCKSCLPEAGYRKKLYKNYQPELIAFFEDEHIPYQKIPQHNPACQRVYSENAPVIISLTNDMEYLLFKNESNKLMLRCAAENGVEHVFWYMNNKLIGKAKSNDKLFFTPPEGDVKISCTDDKGRNTNIFIRVNYL